MSDMASRATNVAGDTANDANAPDLNAAVSNLRRPTFGALGMPIFSDQSGAPKQGIFGPGTANTDESLQAMVGGIRPHGGWLCSKSAVLSLMNGFGDWLRALAHGIAIHGRPGDDSGRIKYKDVAVPASSAKNTMARQWELLKLLPSRYPGLTAQEICQRLSGEGYQVSKRTIERDLNDLSQLFPLQCNDKGMPYGWYWMKDRTVDIPGLALSEALTLRLVEDYIRPLVPAEMLAGLEARFSQARQKLQTLHTDNSSARWLDKVASVHPDLPLLPPQLDAAVLETVQSALLEERQVQCCYYSAHTDRTATHNLNPLGLVQRGQITYLVATAFPHQDVRLWAVHRIRSAKVTEAECVVPDGFTLKGYIETGAMAFGIPKTIELKAWITSELARLISETPLSEDMTLEDAGEGKVLTATVTESWQLKWWALSHAGSLVVLGPPEFKQSIRERLERAQEMYADEPELSTLEC